MRYQDASASASRRTSRTARLRPFAPVGGTMCAASPARKSRPCRIGSATKLRIGVMPFSSTGPSASVQPGRPSRSLQLLPDALVGPLGDVLVGAALHVEAAELGRAHAEQREAALVVRVDELVVRRRHRGQDSEPAERILARERAQDARRDRRAADAVEPVAAGDDVAFEHLPLTLVGVQDTRSLRLDLLHPDVVHLEQERSSGAEPRLDQVLHDLRLPVDGDRLARERLQVDAGAARPRTAARGLRARAPRAPAGRPRLPR